MILTKTDIKLFMDHKKIEIENFNPKNLGPVSYDLTITDTVRIISSISTQTIDITKPSLIGEFKKLPTKLTHGDSLIFSTKEIIYVDPSISGFVYARSSLTKLPVLFNIPGLVDPGFKGSITGVLYNFSGRELIIKKMRICQIVFHSHNLVKEHYGTRESSKNQDQKGIQSLISRTDKEFKS